jgi:hypothetical protein
MQAPPTLFSQITSGLFPAEFSRLVEKYPTQKPPRGLTEFDQFLALCFGQLTYRESLRDVIACLTELSGFELPKFVNGCKPGQTFQKSALQLQLFLVLGAVILGGGWLGKLNCNCSNSSF